jgi:hypothetical protein
MMASQGNTDRNSQACLYSKYMQRVSLIAFGDAGKMMYARSPILFLLSHVVLKPSCRPATTRSLSVLSL